MLLTTGLGLHGRTSEHLSGVRRAAGRRRAGGPRARGRTDLLRGAGSRSSRRPGDAGAWWCSALHPRGPVRADGRGLPRARRTPAGPRRRRCGLGRLRAGRHRRARACGRCSTRCRGRRAARWSCATATSSSWSGARSCRWPRTREVVRAGAGTRQAWSAPCTSSAPRPGNAGGRPGRPPSPWRWSWVARARWARARPRAQSLVSDLCAASPDDRHRGDRPPRRPRLAAGGRPRLAAARRRRRAGHGPDRRGARPRAGTPHRHGPRSWPGSRGAGWSRWCVAWTRPGLAQGGTHRGARRASPDRLGGGARPATLVQRRRRCWWRGPSSVQPGRARSRPSAPPGSCSSWPDAPVDATACCWPATSPRRTCCPPPGRRPGLPWRRSRSGPSSPTTAGTGTELLRTLDTYLTLGTSKAAAASALGIRRQSLYDRLAADPAAARRRARRRGPAARAAPRGAGLAPAHRHRPPGRLRGLTRSYSSPVRENERSRSPANHAPTTVTTRLAMIA